MEGAKRVIALGFFDGVHLGHGALLRRAASLAGPLGATASAFTFDVHPGQVILGQPLPLLTTCLERLELMERLYGVEDVLVARFDAELMHMPWQAFVTDVLLAGQKAVHLVAGHDYRFGYRGEGGPEGLARLCARLGVGCDIIPPVCVDGRRVSSSYIRTLVAQGEMERAAQFLGHPHAVTDVVRHGKKLGSRLGFPTVNLHLAPGVVSPAFGVYAARMWVDGRDYAAAVNVGTRPTVDDGDNVTVEGFLLDFSGNLYGKTVRMEFYRHLRPERKFQSVDALREQIMKDAEQVRGYFA